MKKSLPLSFLKNFNPSKSKYTKVIFPNNEQNVIVKYTDIEHPEYLYFFINKYDASKNKYYISTKPVSENQVMSQTVWVDINDLNKRFNLWVKMVNDYNECESIFDDPIVESYYSEFFNEYKILEEDADVSPFDIKRQILIDNYLDESIAFLEKFENKFDNTDLSEPIKIANDLKSSLTTLTKNQVIQKLSYFWAVARKKGLPILKELFFELAKTVIKEIGKKMIGL